MQLWVSRNRDLDGEHFAGLELAGGDGLGILDVFAGIDQKRCRSVGESAIFRPASDYAAGGIMKQNLDSLFSRKAEFDGAITVIREEDVDRELPHF